MSPETATSTPRQPRTSESDSLVASSGSATGSWLAVIAVVLVAFAVYGAAAHFVASPRIFYDELIYMEAADSLARGDGPRVRDQPYEYGFLYPALAAPVLRWSPNREVAYELVKLLNALLFSLAAIPVFLLSRRILRPWSSVAVAALAVLVPSAVYVSVVMTESLAYLASCAALYAMLRAVERPTLGRQGAVLAAVLIAYLVRPQFLVLFVAYVGALALAMLVSPDRRARWRGELRRLWPTIAALALGVALFFGVPLVRGDTPQDSLGEYEELWRSYDPILIGGWLLSHLADLELYLAVVPVAVAPIVLASLVVRARAGSDRDAAFLATFVSVNVTMLVLVAAVVTYQESSGSGVERLHDRYLFYVVPLWLIVLFAWFEAGAPRPVVAAGFGVALAVLLPAALPLEDVDVNDGAKIFNAVATGVPATLGKAVEPTFWAGTLVLCVATLAVITFALRRPRSAVRVGVGALVGVFVVNGLVAWGHALAPPERKVFTSSDLDRRWVDRRVRTGASVTLLVVPCGRTTLPRDSFFLTEFFNATVRSVIELGVGAGELSRDGRVVSPSGNAEEADYVVAQPGVGVEGRRVGSGTGAGLVLWELDGPLRVVDPGSAGELERVACERGAG